MFSRSRGWSGNLSSWDVSNVRSFEAMFAAATSFRSDLSRWNVSQGVDFRAMFAEATNFTSDLSQWDVSKATDMMMMFFSASSFTCDLSPWSVSRVTALGAMFGGVMQDDSYGYVNDLALFQATGGASGLTECDSLAIHVSFQRQLGSDWPYDWGTIGCLPAPPPPSPPPPLVNDTVHATDGDLSQALLDMRSSANGVPYHINIHGTHLITPASGRFEPNTFSPSELWLEGSARRATIIGDLSTGILFSFGSSTMKVNLIGLSLVGHIHFVANSTLRISNCTFERHIDYPGGQVALRLSAGYAELDRALFAGLHHGGLIIDGANATVQQSRFIDNNGTRGSAILVSSGLLYMRDSVVEGNMANSQGGALAIDGGVVVLANRTRLRENSAREGASMYVASNARVFYALPAPLGSWIVAPFLCSEQPLLLEQSCAWQEHPAFIGLTMMRFASGPTDDDLPFLCPPATYGDSDEVEAQSRPSCSGLCEAGTFQDQAAQTVCKACTNGHYCRRGTASPLPCDNGTYSNATNLQTSSECTPCERGSACPIGSTEPKRCSAGSFSNTTGASACTACLPGTFRPASFNLSSLAVWMPLLEAAHGQIDLTNTTAATSCLVCMAGAYCPEGASVPLPCPPGTWSRSTSLVSDSQCISADAGHFSPTGSRAQTPCRADTFNPRTRSDSAAACVSCPPDSTTNGLLGRTNLADCLCQSDFYNAATHAGEVGCSPCPSGTNCSVAGSTLATLPIKSGYFRLHAGSLDVRRCPDAASNCTESPECPESTSGCRGTVHLTPQLSINRADVNCTGSVAIACILRCAQCFGADVDVTTDDSCNTCSVCEPYRACVPGARSLQEDAYSPDHAGSISSGIESSGYVSSGDAIGDLGSGEPSELPSSLTAEMTAVGCQDGLYHIFCRLCVQRNDGKLTYYARGTTTHPARCALCRDLARDSILLALFWTMIASIFALGILVAYRQLSARRKTILQEAWRVYTPHVKLKILISFCAAVEARTSPSPSRPSTHSSYAIVGARHLCRHDCHANRQSLRGRSASRRPPHLRRLRIRRQFRRRGRRRLARVPGSGWLPLQAPDLHPGPNGDRRAHCIVRFHLRARGASSSEAQQTCGAPEGESVYFQPRNKCGTINGSVVTIHDPS